ncbi:MAG: protein kinase [Candidatus Obscuribacterales bacterium]|nr:protein kinase [Candidatus Obscuribacterales bacterium]
MNDDALKCLIDRAEAGDPDSQFELARLILDEESNDEQHNWDLDSANDKELERGARWLILAAKNGQREAQTDLAKRYHYGIDFPENQARAFEWFTLASEQGCPEAEFFLGELYTNDDVVAYDIETALGYYEKSASKGFQWAQLALFDIYRNGADLSLPDLERALYWGRRAGEQGNLAAQLSLGRLFFEGDTVERNHLEAAFWLHLAADLDDEAKYLLALLYFNGHGVEKNITKAADLFRCLARKGDPDAMVQLSIVLSEMIRPPLDEVHSWLIKASELGHLHARDMLEEFESEDDTPQCVRREFEMSDCPKRTASQWRALAEAGDTEAQYKIALLLEEGGDVQVDFDEAVMWYRRAASKGHAGAQWRLSLCYQTGLGVEPDETKAVHLLQLAADGGDADAQLQLGWHYYFGSIVSEDKKKAYQLFKKASERWNLTALVWLGHCYQNGDGVVIDRKKACQLYQKAADLGVVSAQFKLGMMYALGWGVRRNSKRAANWLTMAADQDHTTAIVELGRMYLSGTGVAQSTSTAEVLFRKAANLGDADGKFELGRLIMVREQCHNAEAYQYIVESANEHVVDAEHYLAELGSSKGNGTEEKPAGTKPVESDDKMVGRIIANKYSILSVIGNGGISRVYKARNVFTDRIVAIKVLHSHLKFDDVAVQRLQREAKAIRRLEHPNVVGLQDFGVLSGDQPYMVLDFVTGHSLEELLQEHGAIDVERCLTLFLQLIDGLAIAHDSAIVHKDIKPSNIMVTNSNGAQECAKLCDFGIARVFSDVGPVINNKHSRTHRISGTPSYMSPEQCQGQTLDLRSDIYSLGCVLFEALTGSRAVTGTSFTDIASTHLYQSPPSIIESRPDLNFSRQLDAIIKRMMAKEPNERYHDLHALREDLAQLKAAAA